MSSSLRSRDRRPVHPQPRLPALRVWLPPCSLSTWSHHISVCTDGSLWILADYYSMVGRKQHLFCRAPVDGPLVCFQLGAAPEKATMDAGGQEQVRFHFPWVNTQEWDGGVTWWVCDSRLQKLPSCFPEWLHHFAFFPAEHERPGPP